MAQGAGAVVVVACEKSDGRLDFRVAPAIGRGFIALVILPGCWNR